MLNHLKYTHQHDDSHRTRATLGFSMVLGWMIAVPFHGKVTFAMAQRQSMYIEEMMVPSILIHFASLILCGFLISNQNQAKRAVLWSTLACVLGSAALFTASPVIWLLGLGLASFSSGIVVACWSYWFRALAVRKERNQTAANILVLSNLWMILLNVTAVNVGALPSLILSLLLLLAALPILAGLPTLAVQPVQGGQPSYEEKSTEEPKLPRAEFRNQVIKPLIALCAFILVVTVNSGMMYATILPAFEQFPLAVSWYWAAPYILVILALKKWGNQASRYVTLSAAVAMMGAAFLTFVSLPATLTSFILVDTLMMAAFGICDLFWWSALGELLDRSRNPARMFGIGMAANVAGILIGMWLTIEFSRFAVNPEAFTRITMGTILILLCLMPWLIRFLSQTIILQGIGGSKGRATGNPGGEKYQGERLESEEWDLHIHTFVSSPEQQASNSESTQSVKFTDREIEILTKILKGKTNSLIVEELFITQNTLKFHMKNIYSKTGAHNKTELIKLLQNRQ